MIRYNCLNPASGGAPLIHDIHGEPYKVVKAVYMALPWLWSKLNSQQGPTNNTFQIPAKLTTTEDTQLIVYPPYVRMLDIKDSVVWAVTNSGNRKYKYRNCHLSNAGLVLNIDLQAPDDQKGMNILWVATLINKAWNARPYKPQPEPFVNPWNCGCGEHIPPFNYGPPVPPPPSVPNGPYPLQPEFNEIAPPPFPFEH